jgi:hypothetical protein
VNAKTPGIVSGVAAPEEKEWRWYAEVAMGLVFVCHAVGQISRKRLTILDSRHVPKVMRFEYRPPKKAKWRSSRT